MICTLNILSYIYVLVTLLIITIGLSNFFCLKLSMYLEKVADTYSPVFVNSGTYYTTHSFLADCVNMGLWSVKGHSLVLY